jgi:formylglycine-generating enzyme required for sulfatase activity
LGGGDDLKKVTEWSVRLPTEFEWEKAARGTDGRIYPFKGDFDATKGNTDQTGLGQTSAVGIFPKGASPYGVMDLSGNVWEWCLTDFKNPAPDAQRENLQTDEWRVLRGGSWLYDQVNARAACRDDFRPGVRFGSVGFRVVLCVRPPSL